MVFAVNPGRWQLPKPHDVKAWGVCPSALGDKEKMSVSVCILKGWVAEGGPKNTFLISWFWANIL